jgi:predicted transcriptional regulator
VYFVEFLISLTFNPRHTTATRTISGVSQPVIARMEMGKTSPQIDTILKVLAPLGKTLKVAELE